MRRPLTVTLHRGSVVLSNERDDEARIGDLNGPEQLAAVLREAADGYRSHGTRRSQIRVAPTLLQRRVLEGLPPMSASLLREMAAKQQDRFFRRTGSALVTDARWAPLAEGQARTAVAIAAEGPWIDAAILALSDAGLKVVSIRDESGAFELTPISHAAIVRQRGLRRMRVLTVAAVAAWVIVLSCHLLRLTATERHLDRAIARLQEPAAAVRAIQQRVRNLDRARAALDQTRAQGLRFREALSRVLMALPDSAYLTSLTLDRTGAAMLSGAAREPAQVVAALERKSGLANIRSAEHGGLMDGAFGRRWERFSVKAGAGKRGDP